MSEHFHVYTAENEGNPKYPPDAVAVIISPADAENIQTVKNELAPYGITSIGEEYGILPTNGDTVCFLAFDGRDRRDIQRALNNLGIHIHT